ncbi:hypothetical protein [Variovorax sp. PDC80]|uniref:hypothetical protein n=1 Tax=Variovorax sp. PDC80 TaxID=1882827 RepID=UPI001160A92A|nr:hypothetical protein [Variovorax sp. PDC80]
MISLRIDQFEFDDPGSEESLEIDVSGRFKFPHPNVKAFVESTVDCPDRRTAALRLACLPSVEGAVERNAFGHMRANENSFDTAGRQRLKRPDQASQAEHPDSLPESLKEFRHKHHFPRRTMP